ncbi:Protein-glutamate methylesterase/protein-glutamine glutaminase [Streptomyces cyaneofuscatus]
MTGPENLLALEAILSALDQTLVRASSGEEALKALLTDDFAVILLDVQMPGMDGFETAAHIKRRERTRDIPIIFLTAINHGPTTPSAGYAAGAVDYISKPFDPWVLRAKVSVFVELYMKNCQLREQAALLRLQLEGNGQARRPAVEGARRAARRAVGTAGGRRGTGRGALQAAGRRVDGRRGGGDRGATWSASSPGCGGHWTPWSRARPEARPRSTDARTGPLTRRAVRGGPRGRGPKPTVRACQGPYRTRQFRRLASRTTRPGEAVGTRADRRLPR